MARVKLAKRREDEATRRRVEWPAVVYFWGFGLAIIGYALARVILDGQPQPYHWLGGLVGGLVGIPLGWLWYRWHGDVF